ncbi:hypothetical protein C7E12_21565, partial [Stenotrophomonas maltophilia]
GTTLTDSPSIRPHGKAVPAPTSISNGTHCKGDGCDAWLPKMPAAMPARCTGTTLTDSPSIRPHGKAVPAPTSISNGTHCKGD